MLITFQISKVHAVEKPYWITGQPLPIGIQEIYSDVLDKNIYVAGGIMPGDKTSNKFLSFVSRANQWVELTPLPEVRHHITISAVGNSIYGVGGFTGEFPNWIAHDSIYKYQVSTND